MEKLITAKQSQEIDRYTIDVCKIPSIELMERAGRGIFEAIKKDGTLKNVKNVLVFAGSGGNGGDGFVVGRYLIENGFNVDVYKCFDELKNPEAIENFNKFKGHVFSGKEVSDCYDLYIDAIFGCGLNKELNGKYIDIIENFNSLEGKKISIDIPSGLNGNTGMPMPVAIKCDKVYTIEHYKIGLFLNFGTNYFDDVEIIHIGLNSEKISEFYKVYTKNDYKNFIKKREKVSNKGNYGRVCLIGGSKEFPGALMLSNNALSALKMGVGYSTLCFPKSLYESYALKYLETTYKLFDDEDGHIKFNKTQCEELLKFDVIGIGMGLGNNIEVYKIISYLLENYKGKLLIDADGLNSLSKYGVEILKNHDCIVVLTPHLMEFARLVNKSKEEVRANTIELLKDFAKNYNVTINLKSNVSLISDENEVIININGNPSLAKGGSGDVLSGITCGSLTKSNDTLLATSFGAYCLGRASDLCIKTINENSVLATDVINKISDVLSEFEEKPR